MANMFNTGEYNLMRSILTDTPFIDHTCACLCKMFSYNHKTNKTTNNEESLYPFGDHEVDKMVKIATIISRIWTNVDNTLIKSLDLRTKFYLSMDVTSFDIFTFFQALAKHRFASHLLLLNRDIDKKMDRDWYRTCKRCDLQDLTGIDGANNKQAMSLILPYSCLNVD